MTVKRQCEFLGVPRATLYYRPRPASEQNLALMRAIDELHLAYPQFGSRNFVYWLTREGWRVNRKRVQRLMRKMGMEALVLKRRGLSKPHPGHPVYPYLLRGLEVTRPNQVWSADITYVPIRGGCAYLVAILDWYSRKVLAWELSNTLDAGFCSRALRRALSQYGNPEIFNTDQGSQFTSAEWLGVFKDRPTRISMDGRGRAIDNIFIERLWRTVKYDEIYLKDYVSLIDAHAQLDTFFRFYNDLRPHRAHNGATPAEVYNAPAPQCPQCLIPRSNSIKGGEGLRPSPRTPPSIFILIFADPLSNRRGPSHAADRSGCGFLLALLLDQFETGKLYFTMGLEESNWILPDNLSRKEADYRKGKIPADSGDDFGSYYLLARNQENTGIELHNACGYRAVHFAKAIMYLMRRYKISPATIADMGSGAGFTASQIRLLCPQSKIQCNELSHDAVSYGQAAFPEIIFHQFEIRPDTNFGATFDMICAREFYPFTRTNSFEFQQSYIELFTRHLNANGWLIIALAHTDKCLLNNLQKLKETHPELEVQIDPLSFFRNVRFFSLAQCLSVCIRKLLRRRDRYFLLLRRN